MCLGQETKAVTGLPFWLKWRSSIFWHQSETTTDRQLGFSNGYRRTKRKKKKKLRPLNSCHNWASDRRSQGHQQLAFTERIRLENWLIVLDVTIVWTNKRPYAEQTMACHPVPAPTLQRTAYMCLCVCLTSRRHLLSFLTHTLFSQIKDKYIQ